MRLKSWKQSRQATEAELAVMDDEEPEPMEVELDPSDMMTYTEVEEIIRKISLSSEDLGVPAAANAHLDRYARALRKARAEKPKRDSTLHEYGFK